jgi:DNA-binding transcriptional LysR family regulator
VNINLEILDLRAFLAVFELGSFKEAAELLELTQPALTRRMQALEQRLGVALLERSTRHVLPTLAGRRLEPIARRLLDELDLSIFSIGEMGAQQRGQMSIAAIPAVVSARLTNPIKAFKKRFPLIQLKILDYSPLEGLESVLRGEAEFGINMLGATETDLIFAPLIDDPYVLACHHNNPLADRKSLNWADLKEHDLIRIGRSNSGNRALLDNALIKANVRLNWIYEVNNLTTCLKLVEAGLGASVLPQLATMSQRRGIVVTRPIKSPLVYRTLGIVERRKGTLSAAARILRDMLKAEFGFKRL